MNSPEKLKAIVSTLPDSPGVYRYYNEEGVLIYVGKAKSLKKRVSSYFNKQSQYNRKTEKLVSEIRKLEFTLANTEFDALLLENNFIKQNQPKYNILLKDDKTFPYLCILKERFPRIISTRKYSPCLGIYFRVEIIRGNRSFKMQRYGKVLSSLITYLFSGWFCLLKLFSL